MQKKILACSGQLRGTVHARVKTAPGEVALILIDANQGKDRIDGTQTAQAILKNHDIPIIFLSSDTERGIVEKQKKTSSGDLVENLGLNVLAICNKLAFELHAAHQAHADRPRAAHSGELRAQVGGSSWRNYRFWASTSQALLPEIDGNGKLNYVAR